MENGGSNSGPAVSLLTILFLLFLASAAASTTALSHSSYASTCPMDFNYVLRIPWNSSYCHNFVSHGEAADNYNTPCCTTLSGVFAASLAQHLKETSLFLLPDVAAAQSCLRDFQSKLNSLPLHLPNNLAASCFKPRGFVIRPNVCAGVQDISDWVEKLGRSTAVDRNCRGDLTNMTACDGCLKAGFEVHSKLTEIYGKKSHSPHCFYFAVLYAAGIVNKAGPLGNSALSCIFGIPLIMGN